LIQRQVAARQHIHNGLFWFGLDKKFDPVVVFTKIPKHHKDKGNHGPNRHQGHDWVAGNKLDQPTKGKVIFPYQDSPRIGLIFQDSNLMPWRTVLKNILLPLELKGVDPQEARAQALDLVELVGLDDFTDVWPGSLSGGMAQRVAIARALIQDPDLLLLDEPFRSLDALTREQMGTELLRVWQARRKTIVMITHSISEALLLADRVLVLSRRPAQVCLDLTVDLPRPRYEETRYSEHFQDLAKQLRSAIR